MEGGFLTLALRPKLALRVRNGARGENRPIRLERIDASVSESAGLDPGMGQATLTHQSGSLVPLGYP